MTLDKGSMTRRGFLILAAAGGVIAAVFALRSQLVGGGQQRSPALADSGNAAVPGARGGKPELPTLVAFIGALFGRVLTDEDGVELLERLVYTVDQEPTLAQDYAALALQLDRFARAAGAASFRESADSAKAAIVNQIMQIDPTSLRSRILKRLSSDRARLYRMRESTIPAVEWLYRGSGVPWRARGYKRWPGIPGDWHEILAAGNPYP